MSKEISFNERHAPAVYWGLDYLLNAAQLSPDTFNGKRIVNLGAGVVDLQRELQTHGVNDSTVVSLDLSYDGSRQRWWQMRKIPPERIPKNAIKGDIKRLPFATDSFDIAIASWTLHWIKDSPGVVPDIMRIAREAYIVPISAEEVKGRYASRLSGFFVEHIIPRKKTMSNYRFGALHVARI